MAFSKEYFENRLNTRENTTHCEFDEDGYETFEELRAFYGYTDDLWKHAFHETGSCCEKPREHVLTPCPDGTLSYKYPSKNHPVEIFFRHLVDNGVTGNTIFEMKDYVNREYLFLLSELGDTTDSESMYYKFSWESRQEITTIALAVNDILPYKTDLCQTSGVNIDVSRWPEPEEMAELLYQVAAQNIYHPQLEFKKKMDEIYYWRTTLALYSWVVKKQHSSSQDYMSMKRILSGTEMVNILDWVETKVRDVVYIMKNVPSEISREIFSYF
ncbi:MAG: hypothetical protein JKX76_01745 [Colwellia sp.]|nr:hypothetical protein [Colwellia sp.]